MQAKLDLNHGFSRESRFLCESIFAGEFGWWRFTGLNQFFFIYKNFLIIYIIN